MHKTNTVDYAVVYDGEMWLGWTTERLCILTEATWWCKTVRVTHGEQRHQAGHDAFFLERRKSCRNLLSLKGDPDAPRK